MSSYAPPGYKINNMSPLVGWLSKVLFHSHLAIMTTISFVYYVLDQHEEGYSISSIVCPTCFRLLAASNSGYANLEIDQETSFFYVRKDYNPCEHISGFPYGKEILCAPLHYICENNKSAEEIHVDHPCFVEVSADVVPLPLENVNSRKVFKVGILEILSIGAPDEGYLLEELNDEIIDMDAVKYHTHIRKDDETSDNIYLVKIDKFNEVLSEGIGFLDFKVFASRCRMFEARCLSCGKEHLTETWDD